jgi:hypothetical protein
MKVLCRAPRPRNWSTKEVAKDGFAQDARLGNRSTKKGTEEGSFVRSTGAGGTNKHQKKRPAHNWSKEDSQKK